MSFASQFDSTYTVFEAPLDQRLAFIRRTYLHLAGAVAAFIALSAVLFYSGVGMMMLRALMSGGRMGWMLVIGAFALVGWMATSMAQSARSIGTQYAGLGIYTLIEALIFAPMITLAGVMAPSVLPTAAGLTLLMFGGLSAYVLTTKQDFSFLRGALFAASLVALGLIVAGLIFGFQLGIWFSAAMILLASGSILYSTSNVMHHYGASQYVAAALELFAAVAMLFYYILRLLLQLRR